MLWFIALAVQAGVVYAITNWSTERRRDVAWERARLRYLEAKEDYDRKWRSFADALPAEAESQAELEQLALLHKDEEESLALVTAHAREVVEVMRREAESMKSALDDRWTEDSTAARKKYIKVLSALVRIREVLNYSPHPLTWKRVLGMGMGQLQSDGLVQELAECPQTIPLAEAVSTWVRAHGRVTMFKQTLQQQIQARAREAEDKARARFRVIHGPPPRIHEYDHHQHRPTRLGVYHPPEEW
jgi:hypothetical protein